MKLEKPPLIDSTKRGELFSTIVQDVFKNRFPDFIKLCDKHYFYWDELKHKKELPYNDSIRAWHFLKLHRTFNSKYIELGNYKFSYFLTQEMEKNLHEFDLILMGGLFKSQITKEEQVEYLKNSILEEAIASSQMEGAATTTEVAWKMLKSGRKPRNESEQMIFNNRRGIKFITEGINEQLSPTFIIELHKLMTVNTSAENAAGAFRDDSIYVTDQIDGEVAYIPPNHKEVPDLMESLCKFVMSEELFIHPVVKASMIHFFIAWIHPFKDGNGRTARALYYWYLIRQGYSLVKSISISRAIMDSRIQYDKSFLKVEYDSNDLTYFIVYALKSLHVAFEKLNRYLDKKKKEKEIKVELARILHSKGFEKRKAEVLAYLYSKEEGVVGIQGYAKKNDIVRQTARKDLNDLVELGLIEEFKLGREVLFRVRDKSRILNLASD